MGSNLFNLQCMHLEVVQSCRPQTIQLHCSPVTLTPSANNLQRPPAPYFRHEPCNIMTTAIATVFQKLMKESVFLNGQVLNPKAKSLPSLFTKSVSLSIQLTEKSLHPPEGFKLGITRGSSEEAYFKNHVEDEFRKIYRVNLKINLFDSFEDGIKQLMDE